jgi:predicted PurR-regulated permease PerM
MGLILLFLIFILLENRFLNKKLYLILRNHPRNTEILDIIEKIKSDVKTYFLVKTIISVST